MIHYNIMGDETVDPDEFVYCVKCHREVLGPDAPGWNEEMECACGELLAEADSLITGRMLRAQREGVDRQLAEWTELNKAKP